MQINVNPGALNAAGYGTNNARPEPSRDQKPAARAVTQQAIKPEKAVEKIADQNARGAQLAKNAYAGAAQRGSILNILV